MMVYSSCNWLILMLVILVLRIPAIMIWDILILLYFVMIMICTRDSCNQAFVSLNLSYDFDLCPEDRFEASTGICHHEEMLSISCSHKVVLCEAEACQYSECHPSFEGFVYTPLSYVMMVMLVLLTNAILKLVLVIAPLFIVTMKMTVLMIVIIIVRNASINQWTAMMRIFIDGQCLHTIVDCDGNMLYE